MELISIQSASFAYSGAGIFSDISFSVKRGELYCLLGPNGSGKTTLLDCILGTLRPQSGRILINGADSRTMRPGQMARQIAYVPQKHERTFPYTVLEIVKMGRAAYTGLFSAPSAGDEQLAMDVLAEMGIAHLSRRPYTQLSGGEGQLAMIARALVQQTPAIIMDEPTAHLDFRHELIILESISRMVRQRGIAVIMATHFPNHAFYFQNNGVPTTVALLHRQGLMAIGTPDETIGPDQLQQLYGVETRIVSCRTAAGDCLKQIFPVATVPRDAGEA